MDLLTLKNKDNARLIDGVLLYPLKISKDDESGGILVETLRKDWKDIYGPGREFSMQYYSVTDSGIARDEKVWHMHPNYQEDRFLVVQGEIVTAVADQREDSPTKGLLNLFYMKSYEGPYILLIPKKTLHGFLVVSKEPAILLNYPTGLYNPAEEGRVAYDTAQVKMTDQTVFSWDLVRKEFPNISS
jgi:dTDP-4-dehydrorhamnose 3,5-epimerase